MSYADDQRIMEAVEELLKDRETVYIDPKANELKIIKTIIIKNDNLVVPLMERLFFKLEYDKSLVRKQKALSIMDYFFNRSHLFRVEMCARIKDLLILVCKIDPIYNTMPRLNPEANDLRVYALKTIKTWHTKYGPGYDQLNHVDAFLNRSTSVDYNNLSTELVIQRKKREEQERRAAERAERKAAQIRIQFNEAKEDMELCVTEIDNALKILVPVFEEDPIEIKETTSGLKEFDKNLHGYNYNETISIVIKDVVPNVKVSDENRDIVQSVRDCKLSLEHHKLTLNKWLLGLTKSEKSEKLMKELINLKSRMDGYCEKVDELNLPTKTKKMVHESSDDDSDLEDVPEKEIEHFVAPYEVPEYIMKKITSDEPCCSKSLTPQRMDKDDSKVDKLPDRIDVPVLPFGLDLKYWGEEKREPIQVPMNNSDCHRFWRPSDDADSPRTESEDVYRTRVFTYVGPERRPKKACKARLTSGKLCPRMDFSKCPIHGPIIDRDTEGFPITEDSYWSEERWRQQALAAEPKGSQCIYEEDEDYIRDLEAGTGKSFTLNGKKSAKRVPSGRALRDRLTEKLLNKRTVKRVSAVLDSIRKAKIQKKFGDQFAHR